MFGEIVNKWQIIFPLVAMANGMGESYFRCQRIA